MVTRKSAALRSIPETGAKAVDEYIAKVPEPARSMMKKMRAAIRSVLPRGATETISYRIPAFKLDKIVVWYAAFQNHCSLFPTAALIEQYKNELAGYTVSKGTVQFPIDEPLPMALIKKLVKTRVEQLQGKKNKPPDKKRG
jgi:uncharacterized protein YdhG (YjbR/CyaY superfamily)